MNFESNTMTLKIWDHSTIEHTLEEAIAHVSSASNTHRSLVSVTRSGPNVFTVGVSSDSVAQLS